MPVEIKSVANHALYVHLPRFTKGEAKGRVISNSIELSFETYRHIYLTGKSASKMNIVLTKADVPRPKKAHKVNEIEIRLKEWRESRYLEEVGETALEDDQKKPFFISILLVNSVELLLKSEAMRSDDEGSTEDLEELLEWLAMIGQQLRKAIGNLNTVPRGRQGRSHEPRRGAQLRVHRALVGRLESRVVVRCQWSEPADEEKGAG